MWIRFTKQRTFEGYTYLEKGVYEVDDGLGARLMRTFPKVCKKARKPKGSK